jgi:hypothetical protein
VCVFGGCKVCFFLFSWVGLEFELRTSHLQSKYSTTRATLPVHFALVILEMEILLIICPGWPQIVDPPNLSFPNSWDSRKTWAITPCGLCFLKTTNCWILLFNPSDNMCLLIGAFSPFTFRFWLGSIYSFLYLVFSHIDFSIACCFLSPFFIFGFCWFAQLNVFDTYLVFLCSFIPHLNFIVS